MNQNISDRLIQVKIDVTVTKVQCLENYKVTPPLPLFLWMDRPNEISISTLVKILINYLTSSSRACHCNYCLIDLWEWSDFRMWLIKVQLMLQLPWNLTILYQFIISSLSCVSESNVNVLKVSINYWINEKYCILQVKIQKSFVDFVLMKEVCIIYFRLLQPKNWFLCILSVVHIVWTLNLLHNS